MSVLECRFSTTLHTIAECTKSNMCLATMLVPEWGDIVKAVLGKALKYFDRRHAINALSPLACCKTSTSLRLIFNTPLIITQ